MDDRPIPIGLREAHSSASRSQNLDRAPLLPPRTQQLGVDPARQHALALGQQQLDKAVFRAQPAVPPNPAHGLYPKRTFKSRVPPEAAIDDGKDVQVTPLPGPWANATAGWTSKLRPLSDIRELTEPSLVDASNNRTSDVTRKSSLKRSDSLTRKDSHKQQTSIARKGSNPKSNPFGSQSKLTGLDSSTQGQTFSPESQTDQSSAYSLSLENVPRRSPSRTKLDVRERSLPRLRQDSAPQMCHHGLAYTVPNHGISHSPVKEIAARLDNLRTDAGRNSKSKTLIRTHDPNTDILEFPTHRHPRISVDLQLGATLFVGGGSIEGHIRIVVDDLERTRHRRQLAISRISIDLLGFEEISGPKRGVFLNLTTELIDPDNPPPHSMVESLKQISPVDPFWHLAPSVSSLPFLLSVPLDVGPPPFNSKHARIRYILGVTILIRDQGKQYLIRTSQDISVISVYDPEKALMSLPSPLVAFDEYVRSQYEPRETVKVTAGLHRQVWVSGTSIFVDVHIANSCKKLVKRLELQLERDILCYKHTAASTLEKSATQSRVFDFNERTILSKASMKASSSSGWNGVPGQSSDLRTFDLELPRGQATVKCGKFFEVRYFLNVVVGTSSRPRMVTVQLPIVLIHMNSLDVVPNSVAQVAAAIEEKRARSRHQRGQSARSPRQCRRGASLNTIQGRAFAAPRKQSQDRARAEQEELAALGQILNSSPRKYQYSPPASSSTSHPQPPKHSQTPSKHTIPHSFHRRGQASVSRTYVQQQEPGPQTPPRFQLAVRANSTSRPTITQPATADYTYRTPPPSQQYQAQHVDPRPSTIEEARERLRKMRSAETSNNSLTRQVAVVPTIAPPPPPPAPKDGVFREIGVGGPPASIPTNPSEPTAGTAAGPSKPTPFRRMRSSDKWRPGVGWFADRSRERDREREKDKQREVRDRSRGLNNWI